MGKLPEKSGNGYDTGRKSKNQRNTSLESDGNRYGIYQINSGQEERGYQFLSLEAAKEMGFTVDGKDYQMVYSERLRDATTLDNLLSVLI